MVDFPAPFGPRNPKTSPTSTSRVSLSRAVNEPNCLVNPSVWMADVNVPLRLAAAPGSRPVAGRYRQHRCERTVT